MSDRIYCYTVVLDSAYKDEDASEILNAISMIKGVSSVHPEVAKAETYFARDAAMRELGQKIIDFIIDESKHE